ncbi:MAG: NAD(P)-dependent alcohol dehydrogenase [Bacteroidetes bacterium]|jgi:NADPH:quinone reductase-like Zn-dependent oxidoreductase|nr:NAD(P)-dependent alcohol dehydrogenase [Bacteroidota bacterium]
MKAIICTKYGDPEVLQLQEINKPVPKDDEVCIKIFATSITGSDIIIRGCKLTGLMRFMMGVAIGFKKPRNPILGAIIAGEIDTIGKNVRQFKKGDKIYGVTIKSPMQPRLGTYAEYKCLPEKSFIVPKPNNTTFEEAAAIPYGGGIALYFSKKAKIKTGQKILVYGASGSIGTSLVQIAKYYKNNVTGICSTSNLELVKSLGADSVIDYTKEDFTEKGVLYDIIFDAVPAGMINRKTLKLKCKKSLAPNGKYIAIDDGRPEFSIEGLLLLKELVETGKYKPVIDRIYPIEKISEAHTYVEKGHKKGNVVIKIIE